MLDLKALAEKVALILENEPVLAVEGLSTAAVIDQETKVAWY